MAATADTLRLPALREDIQLLPGAAALDGSPTWAVYDPVRNRYFRIGWSAFQLLSRWSIGSADQLVRSVTAETTCEISLQDVLALIRFLYSNNLTLDSPGETTSDYLAQQAAARQRPLEWLWKNYLFLRLPLVRPDAFLQRAVHFAGPLFGAGFRNLLLALGLIGLFLISRQWEAFTTTFLYFYSASGIAWRTWRAPCQSISRMMSMPRFM